ncbi:hypothetical protein C0995_009437 [Termitomyces sp. Mi166|nr:hypothetical protein C0995_009437 [Termitomyces sp. Mi166\
MEKNWMVLDKIFGGLQFKEWKNQRLMRGTVIQRKNAAASKVVECQRKLKQQEKVAVEEEKKEKEEKEVEG